MIILNEIFGFGELAPPFLFYFRKRVAQSRLLQMQFPDSLAECKFCQPFLPAPIAQQARRAFFLSFGLFGT